MKKQRWFPLTFPLILFAAAAASPSAAQELPRENVLDAPAIAAGLSVSNVFQSNMVLQRDKPIQIWGWAAPGETISVTFAGNQVSSKAADDRSWKVALPATAATAAPHELTIQGEAESLVLDNILVGDVWVLGGQSNMEFELTKVENGWLEIVSANYPQIRILTVPYGEGPEPRPGFPRLQEWSSWFGRHFRKGYWEECSPEVARDLSAIGYVFARRVHQAAGIPIGVIDASRGGTTVEAWTPLSVLREMESPTLQAKLADWDARVAAWDPQQDLQDRRARHRQRVEQLREEGKPLPADLKEEPSDLQPGPSADPNYPGNCYAGMLAPLAGLSIKGAIFHQGYNNAFDGSAGAEMYRDAFPRMITAWREAFGDPQTPFGILSLCTAGDPQTRANYCEFMFDAGIEIRAAQYDTFLEFHHAGDKNVGFASTYDLRRRWYHPQVKIPAGERIARWALATQYGFSRELEWKPPMLADMEIRDGAVVLQLDAEVGDPQEGTIEGFAIAGADRRFHPADATYLQVGEDDRGRPRFDRKQLVLSSPMVAEPLHFRYAWGRNPLANLQAIGNKDLPFATQRSDDWKMEETPLGVLEGKESLPDRAQRREILETLRQQDIRRRLFEARRLLEAHGEQDGQASTR